LKSAADELAQEGIVLWYLNILEVDKKVPQKLLKQKGGTHADEGETSMMLYIAPETVNMSKAVKDFDSRPGRRGLTRNPEGEGHYSPTGIWGDPTLASKEKGKALIETAVKEIIKQIKELIALKD
jgi:creatinine amidohydrolase